jgi:shikimate kinase
VPKADKVYFVGFMGAGKSTTCRAFARRVGWRALDIDEWIEQRERQPIADIFRDHGEGYFRAVEKEAVRAMLPQRYAGVATGGGTFADPDNRASLLADGTVVWLDVPFETVVQRVPSDGSRPLAADRARFEALYLTRQAAYRYAHLRIDANTGASEDLVDRLLDRLGW